MNFAHFCKEHQNIWHQYFKSIYSRLNEKKIAPTLDGTFLFPNMVLYTETEDHYLAEFFGASPRYRRITPKRHKEPSTIKYLCQFADLDENPVITMNSKYNTVGSIQLSRVVDEAKVKERFGITPSLMYPTNLRNSEEGGSLISFGDNFHSCMFDTCLLINTYQDIIRMKSILNLTIINKNANFSEFIEYMEKTLVLPVGNNNAFVYGLYHCNNKSAKGYTLSGQFANLFLTPGIRETSIGKFLNDNPEFTRYAFNCTDFLHEQRCEWIEGNPNPEEHYIQPDLLIKQRSNHFDICDLKKPLLDEANLTKGNHKRRRFKDYIAEGVAQLANYSDYFKFKKNAEHMSENFGVSVDNPNLILIVGNYENVDIEEIKEASRMLGTNYTIMDYDTLNTNFLLNINAKT